MNTNVYLDIMEDNVEKIDDALIDLKIAIGNQNIDRIMHYAQKLAEVANDAADDAVTTDIDDVWEVEA